MRYLAVMFVIGCGFNADVPLDAPTLGNVPELTAVDPAVLAAGAATSIQLQGANFASDAIVLWDGAPRVPSAATATTVTLDLSADDVLLPAIHEARVVNPDGGMSGALAIEVVEPLPVPLLVSIAPMQAPAGASGFELQVTGNRFVATSLVRWEGQARPTTFVDAQHLTATIASADVAGPGSFAVTVVNPAPGGGASSAVMFDVVAVSTERVSLSDASAQLPGYSAAVAISSTGRYVAFWTQQAAVAADTNDRYDIYVRDTCRGATGCTVTTIPVSVSTAGTFSTLDVGEWIAATPDMRFITFNGGPDLVPGGGGPSNQIMVRDTCIGATSCTPSTTTAVTFNNGTPKWDVSDDARYIAFTTVTALDANDANGTVDVYLHDTCINGPTGCTPSDTLVSATPAGAAGNALADSPRISATGRYVAFQTFASDLVADDTNSNRDVYVRDTCAGVVAACTPTTQRISVDSSGTEGVNPSSLPDIDATGRFVMFATSNNFVAADTQSGNDLYLRDTCAGAASCTPSTTLVSIHANGNADDNVYTFDNPGKHMAPGARYIEFATYANGVVAGDTNGRRDVFVRDTCIGASGCTPASVIVSNGLGGVAGNNSSPTAAHALSADGHYVMFDGNSTNLVSGDTNSTSDVFETPSSF